jgi:hypothetical protein
MHRIFSLENFKRRDHPEDLGVDGKIILKWILREIGWEVVGWIHLSQDRAQWRTLLNSNEPSVSIKGGEFPD